jgi:hypothetical protein
MLLFRILVAAPGHRPQFATKVDPAKGPLAVKLTRQQLDGLGPNQKLVGRVVDPQGRPVEGAKVDFDGIYYAGGGGAFGAIQGVDPLAVTDAQGKFLLTSKQPFVGMSVMVSARGFASRRFSRLAGGQPQDLRLTEGASVTGRLVCDGRAVPGVGVGLDGADRSAEHWIGDYSVATDDQGRFLFVNMPADTACYLYSVMSDAARAGGVLPSRRFATGADGATTDLGDLQVRPAYRVSGRVVLADGKPVPAGTRAMLGRADAWDTLPNVGLGANGSFTFTGVPPESVELSVRVPGYRFAAQNPSLDRLNGLGLLGRVTGNISNLVILLEPGQFKPDWNRPYNPNDQPRNQPLRGVLGVKARGH